MRALAWTTTPWTLPTNLALAVGPAITYVVLPAGPHGIKAAAAEAPVTGSFLLAADLLGAYAKDLGYGDGAEGAAAAEAAVTSRHTGAELDGLSYEPLWDYFPDAEKYGTENAWRFLVADYVTTTDGTGIVHQAPAYGEDDQKICEEAGIPVVLSVDEGAKFLPLFGHGDLAEIAGLQVFDANKPITQVLRAQGRLVRQASYEHSYPHCWRCRNPLIYRAVSSWYVEVTKFKDRMSELNQDINWIPGNVKDGQFGKWLANARDWSISRNRYWGSPIPVWQSSDPDYPRTDVYGSLAEIEADFGRLPLNKAGEVDLHRPFIDELTRPNPDDPRTPEEGQSVMRRVEDVLDVWFDSGSMPYGQVHYPFQNEEWFDTHNPADFIVEYIGQTRGWFYMLHILSTALFDRPAFRNVISHGIVLGSDGQKMSKSLRNYPDVSEVLDRDGSDAMRWFLMSSPILRGGNLVVTEQGIRDGVRQVILPLWNVYSFFTLYTNAAARRQRRVRREAPLRRLRRHPGPVPDGQHRGPRPEHDRPAGQLRHLRRLRRTPQLPGHAHQLVRPPQPPALLRRERGRLRRALHRAGDRHPRGRVPAAAGLRGDLARPHRRALRAPGRLAGRRTVPGQPGTGRGDGPGAADLLHRLLAAQGREPARAPAAAGTHRRGTRRGRAGRLRRRRRR